MRYILCLILTFGMMACDEYSEFHIVGDDKPSESMPEPIPTPQPTLELSNPVCLKTQGFSGNRNRWKPKQERKNACVFLIDHSFKKKFEACGMLKKGGGFDEFQFTGFSNGWPEGENLRQTWRCNYPAKRYMDNGVIVCMERKQECKFQLPGKANKNYGS